MRKQKLARIERVWFMNTTLGSACSVLCSEEFQFRGRDWIIMGNGSSAVTPSDMKCDIKCNMAHYTNTYTFATDFAVHFPWKFVALRISSMSRSCLLLDQRKLEHFADLFSLRGFLFWRPRLSIIIRIIISLAHSHWVWSQTAISGTDAPELWTKAVIFREKWTYCWADSRNTRTILRTSVRRSPIIQTIIRGACKGRSFFP